MNFLKSVLFLFVVSLFSTQAFGVTVRILIPASELDSNHALVLGVGQTAFQIGKPAAVDTAVITNANATECGKDADDFDDSNYNGKTMYCKTYHFSNPDWRADQNRMMCVVGQAVTDRKTSFTSFSYDYSSTYTCIQDGILYQKYTADCSTCT